MRLYDVIQKEANTNLDRASCGLIGKFAAELTKAQCFELSPTVVTACATVSASKPSSILAATPMLRLPYPLIWLEWYANRGDYLRENEKPIPGRMGCLVIADGDKTTNRGYAYWAWYHDEDALSIAPFGIAFDWDMNHPAVVEQLVNKFKLPQYLIDNMAERIGGHQYAQAVLVNTKKWYDKANNDKERDAFIRLEQRAAIIPNHHATEFIKQYNLLDPKNPAMAQFTDDVCGELPFVEAFIIMLNSKNILEQVPDDFARLNKARSKQRKAPLKEFTTTKLRLTRSSINRAEAAGIDRNAARMHLCRGHFKTRASGIYWWSPHFRGKGVPVQRNTYQVC